MQVYWNINIFFSLSLSRCYCLLLIGRSANGACLYHSQDVIVVILIACDCNCRLVRIPFDAGIGFQTIVMAFLLLPTHFFFFSRRRRCHRHRRCAVVAFGVSNSNAVVACWIWIVVARDQTARSIRISLLHKLCLSTDIKYNKIPMSHVFSVLQSFGTSSSSVRRTHSYTCGSI